MSHVGNPNKPLPPGGMPLDFARRDTRTIKRTRAPYQLEDHVERFIDDLRDSIDRRRTDASGFECDAFSEIADKLADRWETIAVGHSPRAWSERAVIFPALLMDYRSRRYEKLLRDDPDGF